MKKIMAIALSFVLTACLMTACGSRNTNETSMPTATQTRPTNQATVPGTTGSHNRPTNGGGVVEDIIEDVTGGMNGSTSSNNSGSSRHSAGSRTSSCLCVAGGLSQLVYGSVKQIHIHTIKGIVFDSANGRFIHIATTDMNNWLAGVQEFLLVDVSVNS